MQMYVNYYDRFVKLSEENKTVGIVLCRDKSQTLVEIMHRKITTKSLPAATIPYYPINKRL